MKSIIIYLSIAYFLFSCGSKENTLNSKKNSLKINELIEDLKRNDDYVTFMPYNKANRVSAFVDSVEYVIACKNGKKYFLDGKGNKSKTVIDKINKTFLLFKKYDLLSLEIYDNYAVVNTNYSDSTYEEIHNLDSSYVDDTKSLYYRNCYENKSRCPYKYVFLILDSGVDIKDLKYLGVISNLRKYSHNVYYYRSFMHADTKGCVTCGCNW